MSNTARPNIAEGFQRFFQVAPALDEASKDEVFFIRHDVYARELGFEPVRADQRERDVYDAHAAHCVMRTAETQPRLVGCARLVMPDPLAPDAPLPFEKACRDSLFRDVIDPSKLPRGQIAEVSRLAVMSGFRRRKGEEQMAVPLDARDFGSVEQPRFPYIPVGLYVAAVMLALRHGVEYIFTLTEPRLAEHFAKLGVKIMPIGAPIEHRGTRLPSMLRASTVKDDLRTLIKPLWGVIEAQMAAGFAAQAPQPDTKAPGGAG